MRRLESLTGMRQQEVNRLAGRPKAPEVIASLEAHIEHLDREIGETKRLVRDYLEGHPALKPLAEVTEWTAFSSARQVAAYAGLTPRQRLSGSSVRTGPPAKIVFSATSCSARSSVRKINCSINSLPASAVGITPDLTRSNSTRKSL